MTKKITVTLSQEDVYLHRELKHIAQETNRTVNKSLVYLAKLGLIVYQIRTTNDESFRKLLFMLLEMSENEILDLFLTMKQRGLL